MYIIPLGKLILSFSGKKRKAQFESPLLLCFYSKVVTEFLGWGMREGSIAIFGHSYLCPHPTSCPPPLCLWQCSLSTLLMLVHLAICTNLQLGWGVLSESLEKKSSGWDKEIGAQPHLSPWWYDRPLCCQVVMLTWAPSGGLFCSSFFKAVCLCPSYPNC